MEIYPLLCATNSRRNIQKNVHCLSEDGGQCLINIIVVVRNSVIQFHLHSLPSNFLRIRACTKHPHTQNFLEMFRNSLISFTASLIRKRLYTPYHTYYSPDSCRYDSVKEYKYNEGFVMLIFSDAKDEAIQHKNIEASGLLIAVCAVLIISLRVMHNTSYCDAGPRTS